MRIERLLTISLWSAAIAFLGIVQGFLFLPHVNADALWPLTFVSDLVSGVTPFHWIIGPANGLFPDDAIVLVGKMLGADMGLNFVFYATVYYILVFLSSTFFLLSCKAGVEVACTASAATLILSIFGKSELDGIAYTMSTPVHHAGVLPIALLVFGLMVRETAGVLSSWSRVVAAGLVAAVVFSDIIAVVQIVLPVAALLLLFLLRHQLRANLALFVGYVVTGALSGAVARALVDKLPWVQHGTTGVSFARLGGGWVDFLYALPSIAENNLGLVHAAVAAVGLILGPMAVVRDILKRKEWRADVVGRSLLSLATVASITGPLAAGTFPGTGDAIIRYQIPGLILSVLWVCWVAISGMMKSGRLIVTAVLVVGAFGALAQHVVRYGLDASEFLADYKTQAQEIEGIGADLILAEYWDAKPLHVVSHLPICGATTNGDVYAWATNLGWCDSGFGVWRENRGILLIGGAQSSPVEIMNVYGPPTGRILVSHSQFLIYPWSEQLQEQVKRSICNAYVSFTVKPVDC